MKAKRKGKGKEKRGKKKEEREKKNAMFLEVQPRTSSTLHCWTVLNCLQTENGWLVINWQVGLPVPRQDQPELCTGNTLCYIFSLLRVWSFDLCAKISCPGYNFLKVLCLVHEIWEDLGLKELAVKLQKKTAGRRRTWKLSRTFPTLWSQLPSVPLWFN